MKIVISQLAITIAMVTTCLYACRIYIYIYIYV